MVRHQSLVHNGEPAKLTMRVVGSHPSALSRQISGEVRGGLGSILNSKSEYNRCHIARLRLEEEEEQEKREQEMNKDEEQIGAQSDGEQLKTKRRDKERRKMAVGSRISETGSRKRADQEEEGVARRQKRRKYNLLREAWGKTPGAQKVVPG